MISVKNINQTSINVPHQSPICEADGKMLEERLMSHLLDGQQGMPETRIFEKIVTESHRLILGQISCIASVHHIKAQTITLDVLHFSIIRGPVSRWCVEGNFEFLKTS